MGSSRTEPADLVYLEFERFKTTVRMAAQKYEVNCTTLLHRQIQDCNHYLRHSVTTQVANV
jgi:hypothetical protein